MPDLAATPHDDTGAIAGLFRLNPVEISHVQQDFIALQGAAPRVKTSTAADPFAVMPVQDCEYLFFGRRCVHMPWSEDEIATEVCARHGIGPRVMCLCQFVRAAMLAKLALPVTQRNKASMTGRSVEAIRVSSDMRIMHRPQPALSTPENS